MSQGGSQPVASAVGMFPAPTVHAGDDGAY
jgi:hypothetical protein